jgi:hypothetical protein
MPSKPAAPRAQSVTGLAEPNFKKGEQTMPDPTTDTNEPQKTDGTPEIEILSDESLEEVAGGGEMCSILACSAKATTT